MILVLLGTQNNSFIRLLKEIEKNIEEGIIQEPVIVQAGYTKYEPKCEKNKMEIVDFVTGDELNMLQEKSNLIITHGGVGSIITSIKKDKKVIAVPRLHEYNEHVNDHQKDIVELFDKKKYIIGLKEVTELKEALLKVKDFMPEKYISDNSKMIKIVDNFIEKSMENKK